MTEELLERRAVGRIADPRVVRLGSQRLPDAAEELLVRRVSVGVAGAHRSDHLMVALGVVPEAQGGPVVEWTPQMRVDQVHAISVAPQVELVDDAMVEEADEVCAGTHHEPRVVERMLEGARTADAVARLEHEHGAPRAREVCGGGEAVVAGADDDHIPGAAA